MLTSVPCIRCGKLTRVYYVGVRTMCKDCCKEIRNKLIEAFPDEENFIKYQISNKGIQWIYEGLFE